MGLLSPILRNIEGGLLAWHCPGCKSAHHVAAFIAAGTLPEPDPDDPDWTPPVEYYQRQSGWSWNGSASRPTFMPSVLVSYDGADAGHGDAPPAICHSFVVDGQMHFQSDCTHALAGKTVPIPAWPTDRSNA